MLFAAIGATCDNDNDKDAPLPVVDMQTLEEDNCHKVCVVNCGAGLRVVSTASALFFNQKVRQHKYFPLVSSS